MSIRSRLTQLIGTFRNSRRNGDTAATTHRPAPETMVAERPDWESEASDPVEEDFEPQEADDPIAPEDVDRIEVSAFSAVTEPRRPMPEEIQTRAYYKWVAAGKPKQTCMSFWLEAEEELSLESC